MVVPTVHVVRFSGSGGRHRDKTPRPDSLYRQLSHGSDGFSPLEAAHDLADTGTNPRLVWFGADGPMSSCASDGLTHRDLRTDMASGMD
jgi:hypothetical protein